MLQTYFKGATKDFLILLWMFPAIFFHIFPIWDGLVIRCIQ